MPWRAIKCLPNYSSSVLLCIDYWPNKGTLMHNFTQFSLALNRAVYEFGWVSYLINNEGKQNSNCLSIILTLYLNSMKILLFNNFTK